VTELTETHEFDDLTPQGWWEEMNGLCASCGLSFEVGNHDGAVAA